MKLLNTTPYLEGHKAIPSGAIPLATSTEGNLICVDACGFWIEWNPKNKHFNHLEPKPTQRKFMQALIAEYTRPTIADILETTESSVDNWTYRTTLPSKAAQSISTLILAK